MRGLCHAEIQIATDWFSGGRSVEAKVQDDFIGGVRSGVNVTPTFYFNGIKFNDSIDVGVFRSLLRRNGNLDVTF